MVHETGHAASVNAQFHLQFIFMVRSLDTVTSLIHVQFFIRGVHLSRTTKDER